MRSTYIFCEIIVIALIFVAATSDTYGQGGGGGNAGGGGNTGGGTGTFVQNFSLDAGTTGGTTNTGNRGTGGTTTNNRAGTNAGFVGSTGNAGFIGGNAATGTTANRNTNVRTTNMNTAARTNNAARMGGGQMGGGGNTANRGQLQPVYMLGFAPPQRDLATVSTTANRVLRSVQGGRMETLQIEMGTGGVARISGSVASDHDRRVTENMIRLQPGVTRIESDIQIIDNAAARTSLTPAAKRSQQAVEVLESTTPQGRQLVYVF